MNGAFALLAQCLLGVAAFGCLSLAMPRHARQISALINRPVPDIPMRWMGWGLIMLIAVTAISLEGWGFGLVSIFGALTVSALVVISMLTYRPNWVIQATAWGALAGILILSFILFEIKH